MEKDQVQAVIRRLISETEEMYVQQERFLKMSYQELNLTLERLRYKIQYQSNSAGVNHSANGVASGATNTLGGFSVNGSFEPEEPTFSIPPFSAVSSTPLRSNEQNGLLNGVLSSNLNNNNFSSASPNGLSSARSNFYANLLSGDRGAASGNTNGFSNQGSRKNGNSTPPPNKQLVLQPGDRSSPIMDDPFRNDWGSLSVANQLRGGKVNNNHSDSSSPVGEMMGSPQVSRRVPLEDLMRFTAAGTDSIFDKLTAELDNSPSQARSANVGTGFFSHSADRPNSHTGGNQYTANHILGSEHSNSPLDMSSKGMPLDALRGGEGNKNLLPVEDLRPKHERYLTKHVKAVYEHGRPKVEKVDGEEEDYADMHVNLEGGCQTLVEFKCKRMIQYKADHFVKPGSYVIVGGDRGEDLGLAIYSWGEATDSQAGSSSAAAPGEKQNSKSQSEESPDGITGSNGSKNSTPNRDITQNPSGLDDKNKVVGLGLTGSSLKRFVGVGTGAVLREADPQEVQQLHTVQMELERRAVDVCMSKVLEHKLPMVVVEAEYQFDKKKLTFYYEAQQRMDFRELVRDLYKTFRARIWMEFVE